MTKPLQVSCDLFLDLKLYRVPDEHLRSLRTRFPSVDIQAVNLEGGEPAAPVSTTVYWGNRITPQIISSLPDLKWIHFGSVGVNRAHVDEVLRRGIVVTNSRGTMSAAVSATALAMMLSLARGLHHAWRLRQENNLTRESFDRHFDECDDLDGQTCLIVGFGEIGRRVAAASEALGMQVETISRTAGSENGRRWHDLSDLRTAVMNADYVINLLPLTPDTRQVFDQVVFEAMKPTAFFVNVGRGETVREEDLIQAIEKRTIAGVGLDVFAHEPLSPSSPLWTMPRVILTPHVAGVTRRYWDRECQLFADNLQRFIDGDALINTVDMTNGY